MKSGLRCVERCADGQFLNPQTGSCEFCGSGCKSCLTKTRCVDCFNPLYTSINGVCQKACPVGAKLNNNNECECTFGSEYQDACVSICPEGYYSLNRKCEPCQFPCRGCVTLPNNCLNCREGYELNPITRQC